MAKKFTILLFFAALLFLPVVSTASKSEDLDEVIRMTEQISLRLTEYTPLPFSEMTKEDVITGTVGNCSQIALWFAYELEKENIPFKVLDIKSTDKNKNLIYHALVEFKLEDKWFLADPANGWVYDKTISELAEKKEKPLNSQWHGREEFIFYGTEEFFKNIFYVESYSDLAYSGLFEAKTSNWRQDEYIKPIITEDENVYNPNTFHLGKDGLYFVDLRSGISKVSPSTTEKFSLEDNVSFRLPAAAASFNNEFFVADYRNNRIVVLNEDTGEFISEWTHTEMMDPEGIAVDPNGNIYVASYGNGKILKFDLKGNLLKSWSSASLDGQQQLVHPHGIFVYNDQVFVSELFSDTSIIKYDLNGNFLGKFGRDGEEWDLKYPASLWISDDNIYVADAVAHQVKIFDTEGNYLRSIGNIGVNYGYFYYPYAVGVDSNGFIYVGDTHNHRIQIFSQKGNFIGAVVNSIEENREGTRTGETSFNLVNVQYEKTGITGNQYIRTKSGFITSEMNSGQLNITTENKGQTLEKKGFIHPWSIKKDGNSFWVLDEPGSLVNYTLEGLPSAIQLNLTSLQFDPTESIDSWIYRPMDFSIRNDKIAIANTLPGNVLLINKYGSIKNIINVNSGSTRSIPTGIDFIDDNTIIVVDMIGSVKVIDLESGVAKNLVSPLGFNQPYKVVYNKKNEQIAITEPYENRIQFFSLRKLRYQGMVSKDIVEELAEPQQISVDDDGIYYVGTQDEILKFQTSIKIKVNKFPLPEEERVTIINANEYQGNSPFLKVYGGVTDKAMNYWNYYQTAEGIVKYDFNFSWLNFDVPVAPGYGNHIWPTGIAHYALLNFYQWELTGDLGAKERFLTHVHWLMDQAIHQSNGAIYWPNKIVLNRSNVEQDYISSTAQTGIAATFQKASIIDPENANIYDKYVEGALLPLTIDVKQGGLRTTINEKVFYIEYPSQDLESQTYEVVPFLWTMVFMREIETKMANGLLGNGQSTLEQIANDGQVMEGNTFWSEQFMGNTIDMQSSKMISKMLRALE